MAIAGLSIRLYFDHHVRKWYAESLRKAGFEVVVPIEAGTAGLDDDEALRWATGQGLTVFTFDQKDFPRIAKEWQTRGESHAGIIVSVSPDYVTPREVLRRLRSFLDHVTAGETVDQLLWLQPVP